jgi:hypothetical protein
MMYGGLRHKACIRWYCRITEKRDILTAPRRSPKLCRSLVLEAAAAGLRLDAYRKNLMRVALFVLLRERMSVSVSLL